MMMAREYSLDIRLWALRAQLPRFRGGDDKSSYMCRTASTLVVAVVPHGTLQETTYCTSTVFSLSLSTTYGRK